MYLRLSVQREVLLLFFHTFLCNLTVINTGAVVGYSSVVLSILTNNTSSITLNAMEIPLFASIIPINEIIGCLLCFITMNYGRRYTIIIYCASFCLGWILIASSYNVTQLFIGRALTGIAIGLSTVAPEIYVAEISIVSWRAVVTATTHIARVVGVLIIYFLGFVIQDNWRLMAASFSIFSILIVLCSICFIQESPIWLLLKGRKQEARVALLRIRGLRQETAEFQEEFAKIVNHIELTNNYETSRNCQIDSSLTTKTGQRSFLTWNVWSILKRIYKTVLLPEVWKPFVVLNLYFLVQKFSGLIVIVYYTVDIITKVSITINPYFITVIIGIIKLIFSVFTACCSRRIGRRIISIVSGTGVSLSLGILAVYLQFFENTGVETVPLVCILSYVAFGSFGFIQIPGSMIGELYPTKYVNVLGQLTICISFFCNYAAIQLYPAMVKLDINATIYFYCVVAIIGTLFLTVALPETRGKTKTQIEEAFREKLQIDETFKKIDDAC